MKEVKGLASRDDFGVFVDSENTVRVDSLYLARVFDRRHGNVLRDIERLAGPDSGLSEEFRKKNFRESFYVDRCGRMQRCYHLTKDGFLIAVSSCTGKKGIRLRERYLVRFNETERIFLERKDERSCFSFLEEHIKLLYGENSGDVFLKERDMLYRVALGMTVERFRTENGIGKGESIFSYLSEEQMRTVETLQVVDLGLLISTPSRELRKRWLEYYKGKTEGKI